MDAALRYCLLFTLAAGLAVPASGQIDNSKSRGDTTKRDTNETPVPKGDPIENAVVKVFSTVRYPDYYRPWTKEAPSEISGSGVVIEGKRILSNAHVVLYASQIQVQANQAGDKISATVVAIAPDMDLAVLKLDDESFFESHHPLARAQTLPQIKDAVMAYGYPEGGTSLSITKGIVSRIEFTSYNFPASGLRIQIDAAINPGNSGGPAVVGEKMIGLAFSHLGGAESIGYIIPCEEIELFLADIADGHYDGKPAMFDDLQTFENPALRAFLKLDKSVHGLIVHKPDSPDAAYPLKQWDVITRIGDTAVDDEGMIMLGDLRVHFAYMVQKVVKNGKIPLTIVRAGKEIAVELPVKSTPPMILAGLDGAYPPYFVYGSLVFSSATSDFVGGLMRGNSGRRWMTLLMGSGSPLLQRVGDKQSFEGERLVVVSSPFFPHKVSKGYSNPLSEVVKTINGVPIKNLEHLVHVLRDCKDPFITIEFDSRRAETLVFSRAEMLAATDDILTDNGVRSQGSPDLMAIWNAR
jgi:S1-C subfamily serine protease